MLNKYVIINSCDPLGFIRLAFSPIPPNLYHEFVLWMLNLNKEDTHQSCIKKDADVQPT